ncbi:uncharacterized protein LOC135375528 [Ornithodoros turicata]|uniref:uncharacterized protein LOC135375528 n=1 Tax=Ornithodoros turicata TaxID=34597 RepID=UPI0031387885
MFLREQKTESLEDLTALADRYLEAQGQNHLGRERSESTEAGGELDEVQPRNPLVSEKKYEMEGGATFATRKAATKPQASCVVVQTRKGDSSVEEGYVELKNGVKVPVVNAFVSPKAPCRVDGMPVVTGKMGNRRVSVLRDAGRNTVIIRKALVEEECLTGEVNPVYLVDSTVKYLPEARISVHTPFYSGVLTAKCMENPLYDVILGNIPSVREPSDPDPKWEEAGPDYEDAKVNPGSSEESGELIAAVQTRRQSKKKPQGKRERPPLRVPEIEGWSSQPGEIGKEQREEDTLRCCFERIGQDLKCRNANHTYEFTVRKGILYRIYRMGAGKEFQQMVVPRKFWEAMMKLAHEGIMSGHQGADVKRFVKSCDQCQRTTPRGNVTKAPFGRMPSIETPLQRVAVDLIGPISPATTKGNQFILTMVDYATRYPDAVALPGITTERVAEGLVEMFTRTGVPREILSDRGPAFISEAMQEVSRLLSLKQLHNSPYHPMGNGLVERFNGTIKTMLKRMCEERPKDWDQYLAHLLFAYWEVPQASLGFSPFEVLYGRHLRGPLSVLREWWTNEEIEHDVKTTHEHVFELRNKLEETCKIAHEELDRAGARYRQQYNKRARQRPMEVGQRVLILLPSDHNKLLMHWKGPYPIVGKKGEADYAVDLGHGTKVFHANLLKIYKERYADVTELVKTTVCSVVSIEESER